MFQPCPLRIGQLADRLPHLAGPGPRGVKNLCYRWGMPNVHQVLRNRAFSDVAIQYSVKNQEVHFL